MSAEPVRGPWPEPEEAPGWCMDLDQVSRALASDPSNESYRRLYAELTGRRPGSGPALTERRPWSGGRE